MFTTAYTPISYLRQHVVPQGFAGVVFVYGRHVDVLQAGRHRARTRGIEVCLVDLRPRLAQLALQEVPTADAITVRVSIAALLRTIDPVAYLAAGANVEQIAYLAVQVSLRELVASLTYEELIAQRVELPARLLDGVRDLAALGVAVESTEVRDLVLPADLRRAQASVLVARAEGEAALERARGESAALRSLANAARVAADNPALLQLRLIQQLESSAGHTVVINP